MRPNIVTEAGLHTRVNQWWEGIPFLTSAVVIICGAIYFICLLAGYDSYETICFLPSSVISHFQVYRIYTAVVFHGSLLHVTFNMLALVPLGSALERLMGSVRLLYIMTLLATSNGILHICIAVLAAYNPFYSLDYLMYECAIGFSGVLFSLIVIETSLSGDQARSFFGLFSVPAKWYPWILLIVFQLLMSNVSLLGHLCGILSGFAYSYGLFNILIPGTSFYSAIESSPLLSTCIRRPKFIVCTGGNTAGYIPTYSTQTTGSGALLTGNLWRNLSSWMPNRGISAQSTENSRFPGQGRTLAGGGGNTVPSSDSSLQARLLDDNATREYPVIPAGGGGQHLSDGRLPAVDNSGAVAALTRQQGQPASDEEIQKLVSMGFEKTQVEVALAAADGDLNVAVEILMTQQS